MANLDKNILITPNVGSNNDPQIVFSAANTTSNAANITLRAYPTSNGTLSFEGSAGQLFSITNNLTGSLFSVNDISGIPSIEVLDTGRVNLAQYNGSVVIGANTSATTSNSNTTGELVVFGGVGVTGNIYVGGTSAGSNGIYTDILRYAANGLPWVMGSGGGGGGTSIDQAARDTANSASANTIIIQGVDVTQNTRLTVSEGVDLSQNVRLDFSNAAITIVQGVDVGQNSRMTIIEGTDASQNVRIDYSNTAITIIQGTDTSQNARMVIIEGTDVSQNARMVIIEGVDVTQNTRLTVSEGVDVSQNVRIDYSNTAITIIQGVDVGQNTRLSVIEDTNASQNVRLNYSNTALTQVDNKAQAAFDKANTGGGGGGTGTGNANTFGWLADTIIVANSTGYLSNSNIFFTSSNNTFITTGPVLIQNTRTSSSVSTGALVVNGGIGAAGVSHFNFIQVVGNVGFTQGGIITSAQLDLGQSAVFTTPNWSTAYTPTQYGGIRAPTPSFSFTGGGFFNNTVWLSQFGSSFINSVAVPTSGNIATLLIAAPFINPANTNLANVVPYSLWANGSIYTANNVTVANSVIVSRGVEIVTSVIANNVVTSSASVVLNDITNQFDNLKCVFDLRSEQSNVINIMNSRNLEVIINGAKLAPYVTNLRYPWLTPYDSFKGHRVVSSNTSSQLVIYNPPAPGDQAILTLINNSSSPQNRRYPYSAATIALGD